MKADDEYAWIVWNNMIKAWRYKFPRPKKPRKEIKEGDYWDGVIDNGEATLEEYVSKYGWDL